MKTTHRLALFIAAFAVFSAVTRADDAASLTSALPICNSLEIAIGDSGQFKKVTVRPATEAIQGDWKHLVYTPGGTPGAPEYVVRFSSGKTLVGEEAISFATGTITYVKSDKYPAATGTIAFDPKSDRALKLQSELKNYSK